MGKDDIRYAPLCQKELTPGIDATPVDAIDRLNMLSIDREKQICRITIDRPPVNALDHGLLEQLTDDFTRAGKLSDHVIMISGRPGRFCAGLDTKIIKAPGAEGLKDLLALLSNLLEVVARCPVPTMAAVSGHCLGGGTVLAALCDYRLMAEGNFKIGLPEINIGLQLPRKVHTIIARLTGPQLAQRLCVEGLLLTPEQARQAGLLDELTAADDLAAKAVEWCLHVLSLPREPMLAMRADYRQELHSLCEVNQ